jgi:hypothetical protein
MLSKFWDLDSYERIKESMEVLKILPKCQLLNTLKYACSHTWKKKKNVT